MTSSSAKNLEEGTYKNINPVSTTEDTECRLMTKAFDLFITSRFTVFVLRAFFVVLLVRVILDIMIEVFMLHGAVNNPAMKNGEMSITMGRHFF
jgi:hypothetical protein